MIQPSNNHVNKPFQIDFNEDKDLGIEQDSLIDLPIDRVFIDLLHLHIRIAEKIVKSVGKIFYDLKIKEKSGRKQIGKVKALEILNEIMSKYYLPTFREDHAKSFKLNKFFTGDDLVNVNNSVTDLFRDLKATQEDHATWTTFTAAIKLAKTWEKGNGLSVVDDKTKKDLRKACKSFFDAYKNNKTFKAKITPYVHLFTSHVPDLLDKTTNLQRFTQQGAEHWMGTLQRMFLAHTNHQLGADISKNGKVTNAITRLFKIARTMMVLPKKYPTPFSRSKDPEAAQ